MIWILAAFIQATVLPEHAAAYSRIDTLAAYAGDAALCSKLGYAVSDDFTPVLAERSLAEMQAEGVSEETATVWVNEALQRTLKARKAEMDSYTSSLDDEAEIASSVRAMYASLQAKCATIAADPISFGIITAGTPDELLTAKTAMEDQLLADVGAASWQTPAIWARGELLIGLGVCKNVMPRSEHDSLLAEHLPASSDRTSAGRWVSAQYLAGLRSFADMDLDATQCRRLISGRISDLNSAAR